MRFSVLVTAMGFAGWIGCAAIPPAVAQSALERLEAKIRSQAGAAPVRPDDPAPRNPTTPPPPPAPAGAALADPAGRPAAGRPYLGISADDTPERGRGAWVQEVTPNGPAAKAGIVEYDIITSVGGRAVSVIDDLSNALQGHAPGDHLSFELKRAGKPLKVDVTLGGAPTDARSALPTAEWTPPASSVLPPPPADAAPAGKPADDHARIEQLERRLEQLERRVHELEAGSKAGNAPR